MAAVTLPVLGSDGGIVIITLPILVNDAGGITLPGVGADSGVTLTCESSATCGAGFHCDTDLQICLPTLSVGGACSELTGFLCASSECSDAGTCVPVPDAGSGSQAGDAGGPTGGGSGGDDSADNGGGSTGNGSGSSGGSAGDDSSGSGTGSTGGSAAVTGSGSAGASAGGSGVRASADAGAAPDAEDGSDGNGVGCSMSPPGGTKSHSIPFELVLGFVAMIGFGAARRRRAAAAR